MSYETTDVLRTGQFDVGQGHRLHWSEAGNPTGKPVVLLHGGPGAGSSPGHRRLFDPSKYRIIQFDQRNCGQSTPYAGEPEVDLSANTTQYLIGDVETLRTHLGIERWLVWGGSWGTTLGLAYAETHPESVTELVLAAVVSTNSTDVAWVTRTVGRLFPEEWQAFKNHLPSDQHDGNLAQAYNVLLMNSDPAIHAPAASAWCRWEDAHVSLSTGRQAKLRYEDPAFRLCFSRIVTHYWANAAFQEDDHLLANANRLADIPTYLAHGRLDVSSPVDFPIQLADAIPATELFIAENDGHGGTSLTDWTTSITTALAT
ncbi:MAG: prolyl aminopeptidase [Acidimicrobiia bacterium]